MSVGELRIGREPVNEFGCVRLQFDFYPNGELGKRNEYLAGRLYLREGEANWLIGALAAEELWTVRTWAMPTYAQMAGTEPGSNR
jgi:hypothetical protein